MQENRDILDDIDIESKRLDTGTNSQLLRGFVLGLIIQFLLWVLFFEGLDNFSNWIGKSILKINSIGYELNSILFIVYSGMIIGALSFLLIGNGKNQPYPKLLIVGFLFSIRRSIRCKAEL